ARRRSLGILGSRPRGLDLQGVELPMREVPQNVLVFRDLEAALRETPRCLFCLLYYDSAAARARA
ncbi:MAG: hypothetical protein ACHREM_09175, partial [Polyangiales bacterium]